MINRDIGKDYRIDVEQGVTRCMGDEELYRTILTMFLEDDTFSRAQEAFSQGDDRALFHCAHELKGVTGNASLTNLYEMTGELVEYLRGGEKNDYTALFSAMETAYARTREGIVLLLEPAAV